MAGRRRHQRRSHRSHRHNASVGRNRCFTSGGGGARACWISVKINGPIKKVNKLFAQNGILTTHIVLPIVGWCLDRVDTARHTSRNSAPIRTNTYGFHNTPHHTAHRTPPTLSDIQIHSCIEYCITWSSSSAAPASAARNSFHIHGIFEIVFSLIFFSCAIFATAHRCHHHHRRRRPPHSVASCMVFWYAIAFPLPRRMVFSFENVNVQKMRINHSKNRFDSVVERKSLLFKALYQSSYAHRTPSAQCISCIRSELSAVY